MQPIRICLIEDDAVMGKSLVSHFTDLGFDVQWFPSGADAIESLQQLPEMDIFVSDIRLPDVSGEDLFYQLRAIYPTIPIILITAFGSVEQAVRLMKEGLEDYITKPFDMDDLLRKIRYQVAKWQEERQARSLVRDLQTRMQHGEVVAGSSFQMREVEKLLAKVRDLPTPLLFTGETGVGKEVMARLTHFSSSRADKPFVGINCAALPTSLLESELFGYERGAFTGATKRKPGKFELAGEGTLFLDEIGDVPPEIQVKLLRVLQEHTFERLGGNTPIQLKARLIAATNRDIPTLIEQGKFREDLYYRINVIPIHIPSLRERKEDILYFTRYFIEFFSKEFSKGFKSISPRAEALLLAYDFPGNVRELRNLIERAVALSDRSIISPEDIFSDMSETEGTMDKGELKSALSEIERCLIEQTLKDTDFVMVKAAQRLGISRKTLWEKIKRYHIKPVER